MKIEVFGYKIEISKLGNMPTLLKPEEYNESYFDGNKTALRHRGKNEIEAK